MKTKDHYFPDQVIPEEWDEWNRMLYPNARGRNTGTQIDSENQEIKMSLVAKDNGGGDYKLVPEGTHLAVCVMVVDIGLQTNNFGNTQPKAYLMFEIPSERIEWDQDGEKKEGAMRIGAEYTVSLSQKAILRKNLESWRGRAFSPEELAGFNLSQVLGKACQVSVTHNTSNNGKTFANINSIAGIPKGVPAPKAESELILFDLDNPSNLKSLPEWIQKKIENRVVEEANLTVTTNTVSGQFDDFDDDIPF